MKPCCPAQGKDTQTRPYHRERQIFLKPGQDVKNWELCSGYGWLTGITLTTVMVWLVKQGFTASVRVAPTHSWAKQGNKKRLEHFVSSAWLHHNRLSCFCCPHSFIQQSYTLVKNWQTKWRIQNSWQYLSTCSFSFSLHIYSSYLWKVIITKWSHILKITSCLPLLLLRKSRFCNNFRFSCVEGGPFGI